MVWKITIVFHDKKNSGFSRNSKTRGVHITYIRKS